MVSGLGVYFRSGKQSRSLSHVCYILCFTYGVPEEESYLFYAKKAKHGKRSVQSLWYLPIKPTSFPNDHRVKSLSTKACFKASAHCHPAIHTTGEQRT